MAAQVPADTSVDAHHAGNASKDRTNAPGASGSDDAHHAATCLLLNAHLISMKVVARMMSGKEITVECEPAHTINWCDMG